MIILSYQQPPQFPWKHVSVSIDHGISHYHHIFLTTALTFQSIYFIKWRKHLSFVVIKRIVTRLSAIRSWLLRHVEEQRWDEMSNNVHSDL